MVPVMSSARLERGERERERKREREREREREVFGVFINGL